MSVFSLDPVVASRRWEPQTAGVQVESTQAGGSVSRSVDDAGVAERQVRLVLACNERRATLPPPSTVGVKLASNAAPGVKHAADQPRVYQVHWFGGAGDKTAFLGNEPGFIVGSLKECLEEQTQGQDFYWGYDEGLKAADAVLAAAKESMSKPIVTMIGHSWGVKGAIVAAKRLRKEGIRVDTFLSLDGVGPLASVPKGLFHRWVNVYQKADSLDSVAKIPLLGSAVAGMLSARRGDSTADTLATMGGQWGRRGGADDNIEVRTNHADADSMLADALRRHENLLSGRR